MTPTCKPSYFPYFLMDKIENAIALTSKKRAILYFAFPNFKNGQVFFTFLYSLERNIEYDDPNYVSPS